MEDNEEYEDRGDLLDDNDEILDEELDNEDSDEVQDIEDEEVEEESNDESEDDIEDEDVGEDDVEEEDDDYEETSSDKTIPKYRLDEVIAQREAEKERSKWLEDQLEKLISQQSAPKQEEPKVQFNFDEAEQKYVDLIIEGETTQAAKLRNQIDSERKKEYMSVIEQIKKENESSITQATSKSTETLKFNNLIESYESTYSFLNAESRDYNEEAVDTVNTLMSGYKSSGMTSSEALTKAVKKVVPFYNNEKENVGSVRKKAARKKSISASRSQPPKVRSSNTENIDTKTLDISKLSERDFDKLTAREKKALRGD